MQKLAVLLGSGVTPAAAWTYLGDDGVGVARAIEGGSDVPAAIRAQATGVETARAWAAVAAAWIIATDAGAPLAATLREFALSLRGLEQIERNVRSSLAGPRATARLVMVLPIIGLLFGGILGFDTARVLLTTPAGLACLVVGIVLMVAAAAWNRHLLAAARPDGTIAGLRCDLLAIAVGGGASLDRAVAAVDRVLDHRTGGIEPGAASTTGDADAIAAVLALSRLAGVPAAELLRSQADELRRVAAADAERRAEVLAVRLMLPLGLCVLPAFMVLGVAPLLIAVVSSTLGATFSE